MQRQKIASASGAVLMAVYEGVSLATTILPESEWLRLGVFLAFCAFVVWHIVLLRNEIADLHDRFYSRKRRQWIRSKLDAYSQQYHPLLEKGTMAQVKEVDSSLKVFCETNEELTGYWSRITSGAHFQGGVPPARLANDKDRVNVWHKCQVRRFHLANIITEFADSADR